MGENRPIKYVIVQFQDIRRQQIIKNNNRDQIDQTSKTIRVKSSQWTCIHISGRKVIWKLEFPIHAIQSRKFKTVASNNKHTLRTLLENACTEWGLKSRKRKMLNPRSHIRQVVQEKKGTTIWPLNIEEKWGKMDEWESGFLGRGIKFLSHIRKSICDTWNKQTHPEM